MADLTEGDWQRFFHPESYDGWLGARTARASAKRQVREQMAHGKAWLEQLDDVERDVDRLIAEPIVEWSEFLRWRALMGLIAYRDYPLSARE